MAAARTRKTALLGDLRDEGAIRGRSSFPRALTTATALTPGPKDSSQKCGKIRYKNILALPIAKIIARLGCPAVWWPSKSRKASMVKHANLQTSPSFGDIALQQFKETETLQLPNGAVLVVTPAEAERHEVGAP